MPFMATTRFLDIFSFKNAYEQIQKKFSVKFTLIASIFSKLFRLKLKKYCRWLELDLRREKISQIWISSYKIAIAVSFHSTVFSMATFKGKNCFVVEK